MNLTSAVALVPPRVMEKEPMQTGYLDLMALVQSLKPPRPPVSVEDARERKAEFKAYEKRKEEAVPLARTIIKVMEKQELKNQAEKAAEEEAEADIVETVIKDLTKEVLQGLGKVARVLMRSAMVVLRWVSAVVFTMIRGVIMFLIANPWVALAVGLIALGVGGYYYFKSKKKVEQEEKAKAGGTSAPAPAPASAESVSKTVGKDGVTVPVTQVPSLPLVAPSVVSAQPPSEKAMAEAARPSASNSAALEASTGTKKKKAKKAFVISQEVTDAITNASNVVGVPVTLLTAIIGVESSFGANTSASTSSAKGIAQFVSGTWTATLGKYGKQFGVPADANPDDAKWAAILAAAMLKFEGYPAASRLVSNPSITDLYLTHFLGASGGTTFLRGYLADPTVVASSLVGSAAYRANLSIFSDGVRDRTAQEVYDTFASRLQTQLNKGASVVAAAEPKALAPVIAQAPPAAQATSKPMQVADSQPPLGSPQARIQESEIIKQGNHRVKVPV